MPETTETKAKPNRRLLVHQMPSAEYQSNRWVAKPEDGTTLEEMLDPEYWANVAKDLKPWDRIEVRPADGGWYADLLVRVVQPFAVRVHVLKHDSFVGKLADSKIEMDIPAGYQLKHRGRAKWSVVRLSDNHILKDGEESKQAAFLWLTIHLKALAPEG